RYYFRRRGHKQVALKATPGSAEFMAAYEQALSGSLPQEIGGSRTKPGTVNAAIVGYYQCLAFRELAPGTQEHRRFLLERFRAEHGDKQIATLPLGFIKHLLDRKKPGAARNWLKALRHMLDFAVAEGFRADNPARGIKLAKMKTNHRRPWTQEEIEQYERTHAIGSSAARTRARPLHHPAGRRCGSHGAAARQQWRANGASAKDGRSANTADPSRVASDPRCHAEWTYDVPGDQHRPPISAPRFQQAVSSVV